MITPDDRPLVAMMAMQIFTARIQAMGPKNGYSPDVAMCAGEAIALLNHVDFHLAPKQKRERPPEFQFRRQGEQTA